jgi:poly-gamma-glutamate capsule biosynthesis protein CapA/YwtB (metallophosphatase superfamily)
MPRLFNKLLNIIVLTCTFFFTPQLSLFSQIDDSVGVNNNKRVVSIIGVGDIMLGTSFPSVRYLPPGNNPMLLLEEVADSLKSSDITFGNLEGSFLDRGEPFKICRDTNICYLFRMPEKYAATLKEAGFDLLSLANNHFGDFGLPASIRTMQLLDSLGIRYAGPQGIDLPVFTKDSVTYGFVAFSPTAGSLNLNDLEGAEAIVRSLASKCDIVIVSFHGGAEGSDYQKVTRTNEIFYGEDRGNVYDFAHRMIDCGADVIFGHGPHVTRAMEIYHDRIICYSLGNFCTYGRFNLNGPNGFSPVVKVQTDITGKFISGNIVPVYQGSDGKVRIDQQKRVINKVRELTSADFPEGGLVISENGTINKK